MSAQGWRPATLVLLVSAWLALPGNLPLWRELWPMPELAGSGGVLLAVGLFVWIVAALYMLLSLLAWRRVLKPVLLLFLLLAAANSYFMMQYSAVIDASMLANATHADAREMRETLSWTLLLSLLLIAGLPGWWLLRQELVFRRCLPQSRRNLTGAALGLTAVLLVTLLMYQDLASLMRNHQQVRYLVNPLNTFYAVGKLASDSLSNMRKTR